MTEDLLFLFIFWLSCYMELHGVLSSLPLTSDGSQVSLLILFLRFISTATAG